MAGMCVMRMIVMAGVGGARIGSRIETIWRCIVIRIPQAVGLERHVISR